MATGLALSLDRTCQHGCAHEAVQRGGPRGLWEILREGHALESSRILSILHSQLADRPPRETHVSPSLRPCLPVSLSACVPACLGLCLPVCLFVCLCPWPSACLAVLVTACLHRCLSASLSSSVCLCVFVSIPLPVCVSVAACTHARRANMPARYFPKLQPSSPKPDRITGVGMA